MIEKSIKILLIEDSRFEAEFIKGMLEVDKNHDFELEWVENLRKGISKITQTKFNIIILDLVLPDSEGLSTFISVHAIVPHIPIIILSGNEDESFAIDAMKYGAQDYFVKGKVNSFLLSRAIYFAIERKRAEEEIKKFKTLTENASYGVTVINLDDHIEYVNESYAQAHGYFINELLGQDISIFHNKNQIRQVRSLNRKLKNGGSFSAVEVWHHHKNGTAFPMLMNGVLIRDEKEKPSFIALSGIDITARKKTEEMIRQYVDIVNNMQVGLYVFHLEDMADDRTLRLIATNPAASQFTGISMENMLGKNIDENFPELRKKRIPEIYANVVRTGEPVELEDVFYENHRIASAYFSVKAFPLPNNCVGVSFDDMTKRKKTEEALRKSKESYRKLFEQSVQVYRDLEQSNIKLKDTQAELVQQEKLASIGQLAAGVAHEINNPLSFITNNFVALEGYVQDIQNYLLLYHKILPKLGRNCSTEIEQKVTEILEFRKKININFILEDLDVLFKETNKGFDRIMGIVQSLRDFSRVDQINKKEVYDFNKAIEDTLTVARNEIKYVAVVEKDFGEIPNIECSGGEINQVLLNIIINASQALQEQNRDDFGKILIKTFQKGDYIYCKIQDNGPGIPKEYLGKIFDPFFTTKEVGKGTGLGLSISYDIIVNKHNGDLRAESIPGKGTTFIIKLPIQAPEEEELEEPILN